ncbi:DNA mismatch repair protein, partial [Cladochytrium tenue]
MWEQEAAAHPASSPSKRRAVVVAPSFRGLGWARRCAPASDPLVSEPAGDGAHAREKTRNIIQTWQNPVLPNRDVYGIGGGGYPRGPAGTRVTVHSFANLSGPPKLESVEKSDLRSLQASAATIIGQVDRKFVLCVLPRSDDGGGGAALVAIDQHAADERARLEILTRELGSGSGGGGRSASVAVNPPLQLHLAARDAFLVGRFAGELARWGVGVEVDDEDGGGGGGGGGHDDENDVGDGGDVDRTGVAATTREVRVVRLPALVAERCLADVELAREMVVEHAWRCGGSGGDAGARGPGGSGGGSGSAAALTSRAGLAGCPRGILHILNSKAC